MRLLAAACAPTPHGRSGAAAFRTPTSNGRETSPAMTVTNSHSSLKELARPERLELLTRFANYMKSLTFRGSRWATVYQARGTERIAIGRGASRLWAGRWCLLGLTVDTQLARHATRPRLVLWMVKSSDIRHRSLLAGSDWGWPRWQSRVRTCDCLTTPPRTISDATGPARNSVVGLLGAGGISGCRAF